MNKASLARASLKDNNFYWAKTHGSQWWNLIIQVRGEAPFFHVDAWALLDRIVVKDIDIDRIEEIGPLITKPITPEQWAKNSHREEQWSG